MVLKEEALMMKRSRVVALVITLMSSLEATAGTPKFDQMRAQDSGLPVTWQVRNGEIIYDDVCKDKGKGSVAYRNCRREAQKLFREKCKEARDRSDSPYCLASNRYYPL